MSTASLTADCLTCLADPTRRAILELLRGGELSVREIAARFTVTRVAISKHLRVLRETGLVVERRRGRKRMHALDPRPLDAVAAWLRSIREQPEPRRQASSATSARPSSPDDWRQW